MSAESFEIRMLKRDVRTVLLPLDLTICTMSDPLQKLVAGCATVAFGATDPFDPEFDAAEDALKDLAHAGAHRIITISETGQSGPEHQRLQALISELGLQLEERSWKQLLD